MGNNANKKSSREDESTNKIPPDNSLEQMLKYWSDFLNRTPAAQQLRERMDKWDSIKLKSFCTTTEMVSKLKRPKKKKKKTKNLFPSPQKINK
jgi:hypothetical protein